MVIWSFHPKMLTVLQGSWEGCSLKITDVVLVILKRYTEISFSLQLCRLIINKSIHLGIARNGLVFRGPWGQQWRPHRFENLYHLHHHPLIPMITCAMCYLSDILINITGKKKSRLKSLKTRLFGKTKSNENEGERRLSQSASDVSQGRNEELDLEDSFRWPL